MKITLKHFISFILIFILFSGCKKVEEEINPDKVIRTIPFSEVKMNSLYTGWEILTDMPLESVGICYDIKANPDLNSKVIHGDVNNRSFEIKITGLVPSSKYHIRAFAILGGKTYFGNEMIAYTIDGSEAVVNLHEKSARHVSASSSKFLYTLIDLGGWDIVSHGICWETSANPTINSSAIVDTSKVSVPYSREIIIPGLTFGVKYYVRAFIETSNGATYYSNEINFSQGQGARHMGGTIAYIFQNGEWGWIPGQVHGIIVYDSTFFGSWFPPVVCSLFATWSLQPYVINNLHNNMGLGYHNTVTIRQQQGTSFTYQCAIYGYGTVTTELIYAARTCLELSGNGYTDWFLPNIEELDKVMKSWHFVENQIFHLKDYSWELYYYFISSSQSGVENCIGTNIHNGAIVTRHKIERNNFLPIRLF